MRKRGEEKVARGAKTALPDGRICVYIFIALSMDFFFFCFLFRMERYVL